MADKVFNPYSPIFMPIPFPSVRLRDLYPHILFGCKASRKHLKRKEK